MYLGSGEYQPTNYLGHVNIVNIAAKKIIWGQVYINQKCIWGKVNINQKHYLEPGEHDINQNIT